MYVYIDFVFYIYIIYMCVFLFHKNIFMMNVNLYICIYNNGNDGTCNNILK